MPLLQSCFPRLEKSPPIVCSTKPTPSCVTLRTVCKAWHQLSFSVAATAAEITVVVVHATHCGDNLLSQSADT